MNKREAYEKKVKAQLEEWNAEIKQLQARAEKSNADLRAQLNSERSDLEKRMEAAKDTYQRLCTASEDAWADMKVGAEQVFAATLNAVSSAVSRFGQKS